MEEEGDEVVRVLSVGYDGYFGGDFAVGICVEGGGGFGEWAVGVEEGGAALLRWKG